MRRFLVCLIYGGLLSSSLFESVSASNVNDFSNMTNTQDSAEKAQKKPGSDSFLFLGKNNDEQKDSKVQEENSEDSKNKTSFPKMVLKGGRKLLQITAYSTGALFIVTRKKSLDLLDELQNKLKVKVGDQSTAAAIVVGIVAGIGLSGLGLAAWL